MGIQPNESVAHPPSGEYESGRFAAVSPGDTLLTALAYWPGRWSRAAVLAGIAAAPMLRAMSPPEWATVLDLLASAVAESLEDAAVFP